MWWNDAVSKAEVLEMYDELYDIFDDCKEIQKKLHKVYDKLNSLPTVQAELDPVKEVAPSCVQGPCKDEKPTHADKIRSMTDEELAVWIVHKTEGNGFDGYEEHVKAWLDWLK